MFTRFVVVLFFVSFSLFFFFFIQQIIGVFASMSWSERKSGQKSLSYFGTGETFVFRLSPNPQRYFWSGLRKHRSESKTRDLFMVGDDKCLMVGGRYVGLQEQTLKATDKFKFNHWLRMGRENLNWLAIPVHWSVVKIYSSKSITKEQTVN